MVWRPKVLFTAIWVCTNVSSMCSIIGLPLDAVTRVGVTLSLLCCQKVAICFRPIIGVRVLYSKLYTFFNQMGQHWRNISPLEKHQSKGQDGSRRYTGVEDTENVCSKFLEWNFPVWFASFALTAFNIHHCLVF